MPCARAMWGFAPVGAQRAAKLRAEEPVQDGDDRGCEEKQQRQGIVHRELAHIALRKQQRIFINAECLVCLAVHDAQIDRIQRKLRQDTGENGRNTAARVEKTGDEACQHTGEHRAQQGDPGIEAAADQHDADSAAGCQRAVDGQVRHVQNAEGDVNADGHNAPGETLCGSAGQGVISDERKLMGSLLLSLVEAGTG